MGRRDVRSWGSYVNSVFPSAPVMYHLYADHEDWYPNLQRAYVHAQREHRHGFLARQIRRRIGMRG